MANPFTRGSAPARARDASQRPGSFKPGHKKVGGRKKGTPNRMSADYKQAVLAVADRVGMDGMGEGGLIGYLCHLAVYYPAAYCKLLCRVMDIQEAYPEHLSGTAYQLNADPLQYNQRSEDPLIDELTIMAIKEPEAFGAAIGALLAPPSKHRRQPRER